MLDIRSWGDGALMADFRAGFSSRSVTIIV